MRERKQDAKGLCSDTCSESRKAEGGKRNQSESKEEPRETKKKEEEKQSYTACRETFSAPSHCAKSDVSLAMGASR